MMITWRSIVLYAIGGLVIAGLVWAFSFNSIERADFTFCNGAEIKTVDPAIVTGQPEGRVIWAIFEGLCSWHPKTLEPVPGVAERWKVSEDGLTYTFYLRDNALWTDGTPVVADDFYYSFRRMLHPETASEYAYELWYIDGAERYTTGRVEPGDPVEVELLEKPNDALPFARGKIIYGRLVDVEPAAEDGEPVYIVEVDGKRRRFQKPAAGSDTPADSEAENYAWILYDFRRVGIEVTGPREIRFHLKHPVPYFVNLLGFYPMSPVNRRCVETYGYPAWTKPENIVTNGPFMLEERRIRDRIRLVKNPLYWDADNVHLQTIDVLAVESAITGLNLFLTGDADWIPTVPNELVRDLMESHPESFRRAPYMVVEYYLLNCQRPPLDNPEVRRALAQALNKQEIVDRLLKTGQQPAYSLVPPGIGQYIDYTPPQCLPYDPVAARRRLEATDFREVLGNRRLELLYNTLESHQAIAELIQSQWKRSLNVDVRLQNQDWARYLASRREGAFDIARAGWIADYLDPNTFLEMFTTGNPNNHSRWSNPEYDRLIVEAQQESDTALRLKKYEQAEAILMDEMPIIPIFFGVTRNMVRPEVRGFYDNMLDVHPLKYIEIDKTP
ncbi:MAG: peptide ABC transporter substrate-binding protein [Planctomycetota bacterium]|nr:MAG: peptide ABC transporter substrate-binding protein [Planctomycetota bacterium]